MPTREPNPSTAAANGVAAPVAPLTVESFLALAVVRRGAPEVVAGAEALGREIRWVHSGEVPNIASLLKGGEVLLTTGMGVGKDAKVQRLFVETLAASGVVALAVELGTSFVEIPPALADAAAGHGLGLIAFHREVRFVEITEAVHRQIINDGTALVRRGDVLHRQITELLLSGAEVPDVLWELARFVRNPVVLEREHQGLAYHIGYETDEAAVLGAWSSLERGGACAPTTIETQIPIDKGESWGRLVVMSLDSPIESADRVAVERAVDLIAIALMRDHEDDGLAMRQRGDLLANLSNGADLAESTFLARAQELGFTGDAPYLLPIAASPSAGGEVHAKTGNVPWKVARREFEEQLRSRRVPLICGAPVAGSQINMVVGVVRRSERERVADLVAQELLRASNRRPGAKPTPTICVGPIASSWREAGEGLASALRALPAVAHAEPRAWHDAEAPDIDRLLWSLRANPDLRAFADRQLGPLLAEDQRGRGNLLDTLSAYCECGGRKAETARLLQIERRSLYHRLARIEEILDVDLSDGKAMLGLHLSLRANRHP